MLYRVYVGLFGMVLLLGVVLDDPTALFNEPIYYLLVSVQFYSSLSERFFEVVMLGA